MANKINSQNFIVVCLKELIFNLAIICVESLFYCISLFLICSLQQVFRKQKSLWMSPICSILTDLNKLSHSKWPFLFHQKFSLLSFDLNTVSLNVNLMYVEILQLLAKFQTVMVLCSRFIWITNSSNHRRVWTANLLHIK